MIRTKEYILYSLAALVFMSSLSAMANAAINFEPDHGASVVKGQVTMIAPQIVNLQTANGAVNVEINSLNVSDMDVDFLQIGDTMVVEGHFENEQLFDAQNLVEIKPYS